ncbi:MAG: hypothetical protein DRQ88_08305 [Epsilonproteobacteria bacterium]|nr:MAG: hypothetical protein DRQ89_09040 [Campylobacterota bacterium]RLA65990.1 MAG: hypothetical protein DRQ88_08305 [Campylobacterota bacterium]
MRAFPLLFLFLLVSCGYDFPRWSNSKLPRTILVPQDKYYEYKAIFDEVEDDYQNSVGGKDLVDFKPTDKNLSFSDSGDILKAPSSSKYSYLFFRESKDEYKDMEGGSLGLTSFLKIGSTMLQASIVLNFEDYYGGYFSQDGVFKDILLHEVGHLLGFDHIDDSYSVMNPYESRTTGLSDYDQGLIYDHYIFEQIANMYKDLEKLGARIEAKDLETRSLELSLNYGLSDERSIEVAKILTHMDKINQKRSLTAIEKDIVSKQLLGIDYTTSKSALEKHLQGDSKGMEELYQKAAELNGITPEHVNDLLGEFISLKS